MTWIPAGATARLSRRASRACVTFRSPSGTSEDFLELADRIGQRPVVLGQSLAGAVGLGLRLWLVGLGLWAVGHFAAVWAAKRDPQFVDVVRKHLRIPGHLSV